MIEPFLDPRAWALPSAQEMSAYFDYLMKRKEREREAVGARWDFTAAVSPVDLYCYLKWRFGAPNGFMMMLRGPAVENFCHWHYTLMASSTALDIMGLNVRMEIQVQRVSYPPAVAWATLEANLAAEIESHRADIQAVRDTLERWQLFLNPYCRLTRIADRYLERLQALDIKALNVPPVPRHGADFEKHEAAVREVQDRCFEAMSLAVSLQLLAPVMGEAAIGIVMLLLARPEVRADRRLYEDFARRNIDVRIKSLHMCCIGFERPIDGSEEPFKDFLRLMTRRNDALHGNVDPTKQTGDDIFFDFGTIPLVRRYQGLNELVVEQALASAEPEAALDDVRITREFIDFLISRLEAPLRPLLHRALNEQFLGYRPKNQRIGIILPSEIMDVVPRDRDPKSSPA